MAKNRKLFIIEFITGMGQFTLITGAFLAGFVKLIGGSNSLNGLIGTLPAIMGFFQILSAILFERLKHRKPTMMLFIYILRALLPMIYLVPLALLNTGLKLHAFIIIYIFAFAANAMVSPALSDLLVNSTPMNIRGRYFATRERFGFLVTAIMSFALGKILDILKIDGLEGTGFFIIGAVLVLLGLVNIGSVQKMGEITHEQEPTVFSFKDAVTLPLKSKGFRRIIMMFVIWNFGLQIGGPFVSVYMVAELGVSYTYMMILGIIGSVMRMIFPIFWGKLSDERSWFLTVKSSVALLALNHFIWAFVDLGNVYYVAPFQFILGGFAWSGIGLSLFNIQYMFAQREGRTMYIGLNAAIGGVVSFIAVRTGGTIIEHLEGRGLTLLSHHFNNMQVVFALSGLFLMICPFFVRFALEGIEPTEKRSAQT